MVLWGGWYSSVTLSNKSPAWFEKAPLWLHSVSPWGEHSYQIGQKNFNGAANGLWLDRREREIGGPCREWPGWGWECYDDGDGEGLGGFGFHLFREGRGDGPEDYPIYLQPLRGNCRGGTESFIAEFRLWGGHRGHHSKGILEHIVVGWMGAHLLLAVSGFSVVEVA